MSSNSDNSAFAKAETPQTPYSVSQGFEYFDWNKFLDKTSWKKSEHIHAIILSRSWVTCACGNLCKSIPRYWYNKSPKDDVLQALGTRFHYALLQKDREAAKAALKNIEHRSSEILAEIHHSKTADS